MQARAKEFSGSDDKLYVKAGEIASKSIKQNVESGGRPKWQKRKKEYSHPILDLTGLMRDKAELSAMSWETTTPTSGGTEHVNKIISTLYGYFHQYGEKIVKRPFVLFQSDEVTQICDVFRKSFLGK